MGTAKDIRRALMIAKEPTDAQKSAGNYKKHHMSWRGLPLAIENAKGSNRSGVDQHGKSWSTTLPAHYGYIKRTEGNDGDHVDAYMGPESDSDHVTVVDQHDPKSGKFDEHKVMLGFGGRAEALRCYDAAFSDGSGPKRRKGVTDTNVDGLKEWLKEGDTKKPFGRVAKAAGGEVLPTDHPDREENLKEFMRGAHPLVQRTLYHVTPKDFHTFKPGGENPEDSGHAIWLSPYKESQPAAHNVKGFLDPKDGLRKYSPGTNVMPVHVNLKNPLILDNKGMHDWAKSAFHGGSEFPQMISEKAKQRVIEAGYDGIVHSYEENPTKDEEVIAFHPHQIKSAIGNNGQFDPGDPNIAKAAGGGAFAPDIPNPVSVYPKPQRMYPEESRIPGGQYLGMPDKSDMTGHKSAVASIGIAPDGKPYFIASKNAADQTGTPGKARAKTNLFRQKAGWRWSSAPKGHEDTDTIVSVEHRGKHYYTLNAHFPNGVDLSRYAEAKSEPRLRPTTTGDVALGDQAGAITVRGREHPVYDHVIVKAAGGEVLDVDHPDRAANLAKHMEGSKVVDKDGKPLVVYHGTVADVETFKNGAPSSGASGGRDFYFSSDPNVSSSYAVGDRELNRLFNERDAAFSRTIQDDSTLEDEQKNSAVNKAVIDRINEIRKNGGGEGGNVIPAYLSLKNPMVVDAEGRFFRDINGGNNNSGSMLNPAFDGDPASGKKGPSGQPLYTQDPRGKVPSRDLNWYVDLAKRQGHDGLIARNVVDTASHKDFKALEEKGGADNYIAFHPHQIKSAIGNNGQFDPGDPNITKAEGGPVDLGEVRETKKLQKFHTGVMSDIHDRAVDLVKLIRAHREAGKLPMDVGTRFTTEHSRRMGLPPLKVVGHYVDPKNPDGNYGYYTERGVPNEDGYERSQSMVRSVGLEALHGPEKWAQIQSGIRPFTGLTVAKKAGGRITKASGGIAGIGDNNPPVETPPRQLSPLGLYSHGAEAAAALKQTSGSPQQILATLKNLGVKPAEIDASGIANAFSGVPKVTKDDIAEHFRKSSPDIKAKTLTGSNAGFKSYTIPGGTNYRETLLQLPPPSWHYEGRRDAPVDSNKKSFSEENHYPGEYNTVVHLRKKDRDAGKTLHLEEVQSDWAQKGREHGFGTPISQEEYNAAVAPHVAAYDAAMAPHVAAYRAAVASHLAAFNAAMAPHNAALNRVPEAPYVGNTSHWTDLGLKHALFEAAKNGQDRVVWTPGHAQVKRYPGLDEKQKNGLMGYYDDILPKRLMALAREHDPQASFGIHPVSLGKKKFPSLSLTPEMRESILKNGFKAFSSGGRIHKAGGGSLPTYGADFDAISRLLGYNVGPAPGTYNKPGGATVTPPTLSQMTPATYNGAHSSPTASGGVGGGFDGDAPGGASDDRSGQDTSLVGRAGSIGAGLGSFLGFGGSLIGRGIGTGIDLSNANDRIGDYERGMGQPPSRPLGFGAWSSAMLNGVVPFGDELGVGASARQAEREEMGQVSMAAPTNNPMTNDEYSRLSGEFDRGDPKDGTPAPGPTPVDVSPLDAPSAGDTAPGSTGTDSGWGVDGGGGLGTLARGGAVNEGYRRGGMAYAAGGSVADDPSTQRALALTAQKEVAPREQEPGVRSTDNSKRIIFDTKGNSGKVNGIAVPAHMWYGGKQKGDTAFDGMRERNKLRAAVYGPENRDPLTSTKAAAIHRDVLAKHFQKPIAEQKLAEGAALNKLRAAGHFSSGADTLDESEKLDTVRNEKDTKGRSFIGYGSKGVAGHALYTSGTGENQKFHAINTCAGQTIGCGGGTDANGIVDTSRGTCFAPNAEAQYVGASVKRASHEQAKHDPAMTKDWILAHSGALRSVTDSADKKNLRVLFRPNVVDETDKSSRYLIQHLNDQRASAGRPPIVANSYGKTGELHDPENGYYITHSNTGPKVKPNLSADETSNSRDQSVSENIARDNSRIRNTITATDDRGRDFKNEKGSVTPPKGSYMVTNVKRYSPLDQKMQAAITHAKYWSTGKPESKLSPQELQEGREGHFDGKGNPTTPDKAHYGHTTLDGNRYDYQKQHILHPRLVDVWDAKKKVMHKIPTDSRFLDENFLPKDRYMTKNGKKAGYILMTTPTTSTSDIGHNSSFTHHVDDEIVDRAAKNNGEYEIDAPHLQEAASGNEFVAPRQNKYFARGGNVGRDIDDVDSDEYDVSFPERSHRAQKHLMHRRNHDDHDHDQHHFGHGKPDIDRALSLTAQYQPPLPGRQQSKPGRR